MSRLTREIIGRSTMLVLGLALLWAGWRCWRKERELLADWDQRHVGDRRSHTDDDRMRDSGAYYVNLVTWLLLGGGAITVAAAFTTLKDLPELLGAGEYDVPPIRRTGGAPTRRP